MCMCMYVYVCMYVCMYVCALVMASVCIIGNHHTYPHNLSLREHNYTHQTRIPKPGSYNIPSPYYNPYAESYIHPEYGPHIRGPYSGPFTNLPRTSPKPTLHQP